ncbi:hypothetical protein Vi05172_g969 [Venturia inaequalis]|nr:hypothetical protein Vi05172_g969 [Venturia inaequalis]
MRYQIIAVAAAFAFLCTRAFAAPAQETQLVQESTQKCFLVDQMCETNDECCSNLYCRGATQYKDGRYSPGQCKREKL